MSWTNKYLFFLCVCVCVCVCVVRACVCACSVQDGMSALGKVHLRSALSPRSVPSVSLKRFQFSSDGAALVSGCSLALEKEIQFVEIRLIETYKNKNKSKNR